VQNYAQLANIPLTVIAFLNIRKIRAYYHSNPLLHLLHISSQEVGRKTEIAMQNLANFTSILLILIRVRKRKHLPWEFFQDFKHYPSEGLIRSLESLKHYRGAFAFAHYPQQTIKGIQSNIKLTKSFRF